MTDDRAFDEYCVLEQWRPVVGFEGLYEVSDLGRVRRVGKAARHGKGHGGGARRGRVRRVHRGQDGYVRVQLWRDGRAFMRLVHCLVAQAFLGPVPPGQEVNHRNGNKADCLLANLEYVTHPENNRHAYQRGLRAPSKPWKLAPADVQAAAKARAAGLSLRVIGRQFGVADSTIARALKESR
jgi:HNH endonuclease/NUMOD4 motif/Helix-turn-helix domain